MKIEKKEEKKKMNKKSEKTEKGLDYVDDTFEVCQYEQKTNRKKIEDF